MCRNGSSWTDIHAEDLNVRFKELVGPEYSVKDLRTRHGTVPAAAARLQPHSITNTRPFRQFKQSACLRICVQRAFVRAADND